MLTQSFNFFLVFLNKANVEGSIEHCQPGQSSRVGLSCSYHGIIISLRFCEDHLSYMG
jgi:hypothetical protein